MDEQQLRALVRAAIARHLGPPAAADPVPVPIPAAAPAGAPAPRHPAGAEDHIAVSRFVIARPAGEVECVIEPSVTCNHCGHCLCYGH